MFTLREILHEIQLDYILDPKYHSLRLFPKNEGNKIHRIFTLHFSGYGHSTPNTIYGKLFTMCYAIIGIPLGLVMFQSIGERLNKFSSVVIRSVKQLLNCKDVQVTIA